MPYDILSFMVATQGTCHHYYSSMPEIISRITSKVVLNSSFDVINLLFNPQRGVFLKIFHKLQPFIMNSGLFISYKKKK